MTLPADGGVQVVNDRVQELLASVLLRRVLAPTEIRLPSSMIEAR